MTFSVFAVELAIMNMFSQSGNKRQKIKDPIKPLEAVEYFPGIKKIEYKGDSASYDEILCYRHFNANEKIHGRTMEDWIKPGLSFNFLRYEIHNNGAPLFPHNFNDDIIEHHKRMLNVGFETCFKLGIKHWSAFDRDIIPYSENQDKFNGYFEEIHEHVVELQRKYLIKPFWIAADLFSNPKYLPGVYNDANVMSHACHQIKRCMEFAQKIESENFSVFCTRTSRNLSVLDSQKEMKHLARLLKMIADFKERSNFRGQLILQPMKYTHCICEKNNFRKKSDSCCFNNIHDAVSGLCLLKSHNLEHCFKVGVTPGYEYYFCAGFNSVNSIEINGDETISSKNATLLMKSILEQGGLQSAGINIWLNSHNGNIDVRDIFATYIKHVDALARGLRIAAKMMSDQTFMKCLQQRYISFYSGFGSRLGNGEATLEECDEQIRKYHQNSEGVNQKHWEITFENFIDACKLNN